MFQYNITPLDTAAQFESVSVNTKVFFSNLSSHLNTIEPWWQLKVDFNFLCLCNNKFHIEKIFDPAFHNLYIVCIK